MLGAAAAGTYGPISSADTSQQPAAIPVIIPVDVVPVPVRNVAGWDEFSGRIEAVQRVEACPLTDGTVIAVHFEDGSIVKKGDALFTINPCPYVVEVARMQAALIAIKFCVAYTTLEPDRAQGLVADNTIMRHEFGEKENAARKAQANLQDTIVALEAVKLNPEYIYIVTPIVGRVSCAEITVSNVVSAGGTALVLATLVSVPPMYVAFDADEQSYLRYSARAVQDAKALVHVGLASEGGYTCEGVIQSVDSQLDMRSDMIRVRAILDNVGGCPTPGLYAHVHMSTDASHDVTFVSDKAIGMDQDEKFVLVVDAANKTSYRPMVPGISVDGLYVVKLGLEAGERIAVNDTQRARPGDTVTSNMVIMDSPVTKRVVLPGTQSEIPAAPTEVKADTSAVPAVRAEIRPANAKTIANAQRLPADCV